MKSPIRFVLLAAALTLAAAGSLSFPETARAAGAGKVSARDVAVLSATFGQPDGSISATDGNGTTRVLAAGKRNPAKFTSASTGSRLVVSWCREASSGGLYACRAPAYPFAPAPGGSTEYECGLGAGGGGTYCECTSLFDCIAMIADGGCEEDTLSCDANGCVCDF